MSAVFALFTQKNRLNIHSISKSPQTFKGTMVVHSDAKVRQLGENTTSEVAQRPFIHFWVHEDFFTINSFEEGRIENL